MSRSAAAIEAAQLASQQWWNDFCIDTGDHPDFVWQENHNGHRLTFADFAQADATPMFRAALAAADAVDAPLVVALAEALRQLLYMIRDQDSLTVVKRSNALAVAHEQLARFDASQEAQQSREAGEN